MKNNRLGFGLGLFFSELAPTCQRCIMLYTMISLWNISVKYLTKILEIKRISKLRTLVFVYFQKLLRTRYVHRHGCARNLSSPGLKGITKSTCTFFVYFQELLRARWVHGHEHTNFFKPWSFFKICQGESFYDMMRVNLCQNNLLVKFGFTWRYLLTVIQVLKYIQEFCGSYLVKLTEFPTFLWIW